MSRFYERQTIKWFLEQPVVAECDLQPGDVFITQYYRGDGKRWNTFDTRKLGMAVFSWCKNSSSSASMHAGMVLNKDDQIEVMEHVEISELCRCEPRGASFRRTVRR